MRPRVQRRMNGVADPETRQKQQGRERERAAIKERESIHERRSFVRDAATSQE